MSAHHKIYDQLVTKQAELSGLVAKLAAEGRNADEGEKARLDALKGEIEGIQKSWQESGRRAFLAGLDQTETKRDKVLKASESFAEVFKGGFAPEDEGLDLGRLVRGIALGNWAGADLERKAMSSIVNVGGYMIPEVLSTRVIDRARNLAAVMMAGAGTIPMTSSTLKLAAVNGDPTMDWYGENATISESDVTLGQRAFQSKKMAALVRVSNELLEDAPNVGQLVEDVLAKAMALELDRVGLFGNGVGEPLGIYNTSGINTVTSVGTPASYDKWVDAVYELRADNYNGNATLYSPRTAKTLAKMVTGIASDKTKLVPPADFANLQKFVTNQITDIYGGGGNESVAFVGQFDQYLYAIRSQMRLEVSREADDAFKKDQTVIRVVWRGDGMPVQPAAFCVMSGITA